MEFELSGRRPRVHPDAYIAPTAVLIGDVEVHKGASVWFGAVLRGDDSKITIGEGANIQDNVTIHCAEDLPTTVEKNASVGHAAVLEGCVVEEAAIDEIRSSDPPMFRIVIGCETVLLMCTSPKLIALWERTS